jgi:hypothetical protein
MDEILNTSPQHNLMHGVEIFETYAEFGKIKVSAIKRGAPDPTLMLILEGLKAEIGFEVLGQFVDDQEGRTACDSTAHAVTLALIHTGFGDCLP